MSQVNLDALIKRQDLFKEVDDLSNVGGEFSYMRIDSDLNPKKCRTFFTLRKPDFQRETSEWRPERIYGLVKSFITGDIIPAVILWHSKGANFIIDGGHRLSAIVAWILDDYGDKEESKAFFKEENISLEQRKLADKTRDLFKDSKEIKPYSYYEHAFDYPEKVTPEEYQLASQILCSRKVYVQWIEAKTGADAEKSFFRINGEATPINEAEALLLKSRQKPNAIAARAIINSGSGHKYWSKFGEKEAKIETLGKKINRLLFEPELDTKIIHFPIAGGKYSSLSLELVFGLVNIVNGHYDANHKRKELMRKEADSILPANDDNGNATIENLERVEKIVSIIKSDWAKSLGLSPLVYFYSPKGRFQITAFFAIVYIINKWDIKRRTNSSDKTFQEFCSIRNQFEEFLLKYKSIIGQATINVGSGLKSYERLAGLLEFIIAKFLEKKTESEIAELIRTIPEYGFVKVLEAENEYQENRNPKAVKPTKETKIQVVINKYLGAKIECPICNARATFESYNIDHILEARNNGVGELENLQLTHCYCNEEKDEILKLKVGI